LTEQSTETKTEQKRPIWQRLLMVLLLVVILIGVYQLREPAANWTPPPLTGDAGDLLYVSAFDGFTDEWEQYDDGRLIASIQEGVIQLSGQGGIPFSATKPIFADFDVQVTVNALENPADEGYGIVYRLQDPDNLYMFWISTDGFYRVNRLVDGQEKRLSTWIPSDTIQQGLDVENTIRVIGRGNQFQFFINGAQVQLCVPDEPDGESTFSGGECFGEMVDTLVDDNFAAGQLGVVINASSDAMTVNFDNFIVISPQDEPVDTGNQT